VVQQLPQVESLVAVARAIGIDEIGVTVGLVVVVGSDF